MAPSKAKFADGEKLLCYHGPLLYEAKCVRSKKDGSSHLYYVHYQGWNKNWDEWVGESSILKINSETLGKKEELLNIHLSSLKSNKKKDKLRHSSSNVSITGPSAQESNLTGAPRTSEKLKVSQKRNTSSAGGSNTGKQDQDDDQRSTSSHEDETLFNAVGEPSPTAIVGAQNPERGTALSMSDRRGRSSAKKSRLSSTTSTTSTTSTAALNKDLNDHQSPFISSSTKDILGTHNEVDSESEIGATSTAFPAATGLDDGEYFGRTPSTKFEIGIPEELKYVLVSDWDLLTHKKYLFVLPAKITVASIISEYTKNADKLVTDGKNGMTQARVSMMTEVAQGIQGFFDAFVGSQLLYNNEKVQFQEEVLKDTSGKAPSDIYGSAHLLRLMVRIGPLLDRYNIREESDVRLIENLISDFLHYLEVNRSRFFTSKNYVEATEEYLAKASSGPFEPVSL